MRPKTRRTVPWAKIFRNLAEQYGWDEDTIGRLTMYRAMIYAGAWCPEDITRDDKTK